ncbi:MAG: glycosyltransferase family 4 protein [Verrucomicrobiota bacterium]
MKVLQVLPELNSGGVERGTLELAKHLIDQGHQSLVLSNGGRLVPQLESEGTTHLTLPIHKKSPASLLQIPKIKQLLLQHQPDILHLRSRVPAWLTYLASKQLPPAQRPKLVTTVHGLYSVSPYSAIMTKGQTVICVSQSVKDYVLKNYPKVPPEKLTVIHRGINPEQYHPAYTLPQDWLTNFQAKHPHLTNKRLLLLPGRLTRWKGQLDFLEILAQLKTTHPDIHGLLAGEAHPRKQNYLAELKTRASQLHLTDHLTILGNRTDLRELMTHAEITLSLSHEPEAFGRVSLEALSLGKPVAAYHHGGVAEQLNTLFPTGKLPVGDTRAAIALLNQWLTTPPPQPSPNTTFTLPKLLSSTLQVYHDLLAKTPS